MAEGWARHLKSRVIEPYSAGTLPSPLNPLAVKVMAEVGIDIASHASKHVHAVQHVDFDYVVTVCDSAKESCPVFPRKVPVVHCGFDDPPALALAAATEAEALVPYRRVRDEIRCFVETRPESLRGASDERA
jgi:arsenate reductase